MTEGTRIPFRGYADERPGEEPGDVVMVIMEKEHHIFQRRGNELITKLRISLSEVSTLTETISEFTNKCLSLSFSLKFIRIFRSMYSKH